MSRVVVVSGGGTGIGRAVAEIFAADGDDVVIVGRRGKVLERAAEEITRSARRGTVTPVVADLTDPEQVDRVTATVAEHRPAIDVLVNNAGGNVALSADGAPLSRSTPGRYRGADLFDRHGFRAPSLAGSSPDHLCPPP